MDINPETVRISNAGGTCKTIEDVRRLAACEEVTDIEVGSMTIPQREGNSTPREYQDHRRRAFFNSLGLPNGGTPYYETALPVMREIAHKAGKQLIVNIAGETREEFYQLATLALKHGDHTCVNLGCPNRREGVKYLPIFAYNLELIDDTLQSVMSAVVDAGDYVSKKPFRVKVSPYEPGMLRQVADLLNRFPRLEKVVSSNTFPSALPVNEKGVRQISGKGYAGASGPALFPIALGNVAQFRECLREDIGIQGVGGIEQGQDALAYLVNGADEVAVATEYYLQGERVFRDLRIDLANLV